MVNPEGRAGWHAGYVWKITRVRPWSSGFGQLNALKSSRDAPARNGRYTGVLVSLFKPAAASGDGEQIGR
ncbi:hypothetical protein [Burkholderia lata]|uniref:Uncharacterized protein n=1 Tax=Burkholderia lata (strain ATCC 17760 / DSM 23089 / LMG 22485 / NCIMB 9086 / R18194 / 383) TaxID=482957 RepID=A0A6P2R2H6_BURL3|nr:hypothetical protein [Burkholderia lata]VWC30574.1 hypothetical protein BLA15945_06417 [Burkholderia lata]